MDKFLNLIKENITEAYKKIFNNKEQYYDNYDFIEDLCFFENLKPHQSSLPFTIFLDNTQYYKMNSFKMMILIENGEKNIIPISIDKNPKILLRKINLNIEYNDLVCVFNFIKKYYDELIDLANENIEISEFIKLLKKNNINEDLLKEYYATLKPSETGLKCKLWLDCNESYKTHAPRIKFQYDPSLAKTREFASMTIEDKPQIINLGKNNNLSSFDIENIRKFVLANKKELLKLIHNQIDFQEDFLPNMIKIVDGREVYPTNEYEILSSKYVCGVKVIKNTTNGKFNYINENGEIISPNMWFDNVYDFSDMGEGLCNGICQIGDEWFSIKLDGSLERL